MLSWNESGEFNVHNIHTTTATRALKYVILSLCTATCAAYFCRKDTLYGIPLPSILVMFGFLVVAAYFTTSASPVGFGFVFDPHFIFVKGRNLLLLFAIYTLLAGQTKWFSATVATIALLLASSYVTKNNDISRGVSEVEEYMLGIVCVCYALELLLAQAPARRRIDALVKGIRLPGGRESTIVRNDSPNFAKARPVSKGLREPWLMVCALIVVCSIGLVILQYFMGRAEAADFEERYRSITTGTAGEPIIRATFDVYLIGSELTYFKDPCGPADTEDRFFLHLIPDNVADLPLYRQQHGFDNLDFDWKGVMREGRCITARLLPDYTITGIRTGQFVPDAGQVWKAEFPFPQR